MNTHLLYPDRDFDPTTELPAHAEDLIADLGLNTVWAAMAGHDEFLADVVRRVLLASETDPAVITHRQQVLADLLATPELAHELYQVAANAVRAERRVVHGMFFGHDPATTLSRSVRVLEIFRDHLTQIRDIVRARGNRVESPRLRALVAQLGAELTDPYFTEITDHLRALRLDHGVVLSAHLGDGGAGRDYVLHDPPRTSPRWRWLTGRHTTSGLSFQIPPRDDAGLQALADLKGRGVDPVANAAAQSVDHILRFFTTLRWELAFYLGCLNLHATLTDAHQPTCFPTPGPLHTSTWSFVDLRDPVLALSLDHTPVGNDLTTDDTALIMITGANQGGKSTYLRSLGLAQLMMQAGMFTTAHTLSASVTSGLYTHYRREEDAAMDSGKLDEELHRMSRIIDQLPPRATVLFNESFAATNEREGSQIARDVIEALLAEGVRVVFVTHLFALASALHRDNRPARLFLRADRDTDGARSFRLTEGQPLPTSYGRDLYQRVFGSPSTGT